MSLPIQGGNLIRIVGMYHTLNAFASEPAITNDKSRVEYRPAMGIDKHMKNRNEFRNHIKSSQLHSC